MCIAGGKAAYNHWRLRKYSVVAEKERKEQALHRQMSERRRGGVPRADEIPFGIRAIERGVEVEGVWVSRPNTPDQASRNGSAGSSIWSFLPKKAPEQDLERQVPGSAHERVASGSTQRTQRPVSSIFDRAVSAEQLPSSRTSREGIAPTALEKPARSRCPPPSFAKYTGNPSLYRNSTSITALEGIAAIHQASVSLQSLDRLDSGNGENTTSSGSDSSDSGPLSAAAPKLLTQHFSGRVRHHSADFMLMNSHRLSQAAETGQLTPRARKAANSIDITGLAGRSTTSVHGDLAGYFSFKQPRARSPTGPPSQSGNPPSSPKIDALPAAVRRSSMPDVTPFAQFVQTAPTSPRPTSMQSAMANKEQRSTSRDSSVYASAPPSPTKPGASEEPVEASMQPLVTIAPAPTAKQHRQSKRPSFEKDRQPSQILRGHGSGFEVLKPGSLKPTMPAESPLDKQRANPPVSLQNYRRARSRSSSAGSGRKLQKKRRPSIDSQSSSEGGRRSRQSLVAPAG